MFKHKHNTGSKVKSNIRSVLCSATFGKYNLNNLGKNFLLNIPKCKSLNV